MVTTQSGSSFWWERVDLQYRNNTLYLGQQNLVNLARSGQTPIFVYNAARIRDNLTRLGDALTDKKVNYGIFYALKANRFLPLVTYLKLTGLCGVDVSSPNELLLARQVGFREDEIVYTNTSVSNKDLDCLQQHPQVMVNCDSISTIRRLGERCPGRTIGIRINPQLGVAYHQELSYAGEKATKFGIYRDRYLEALEVAKQYDLTVKVLHFHIGSGYLTHQLDTLDKILQRTYWFLDQCPEVDTLDIGGGLGVRQDEADESLDLDQWSEVIAKHARTRNLNIWFEPGDYIVKDAGVLLVEVNTVEQKGGTTFIGVNSGFNLINGPAFYQMPVIATPLIIDRSVPKKQVTIAGNINEAIDLFAEEVLLSSVAEGDLLALLNVGGYGSASSSNHCMRGEFSEYLLLDE